MSVCSADLNALCIHFARHGAGSCRHWHRRGRRGQVQAVAGSSKNMRRGSPDCVWSGALVHAAPGALLWVVLAPGRRALVVGVRLARTTVVSRIEQRMVEVRIHLGRIEHLFTPKACAHKGSAACCRRDGGGCSCRAAGRRRSAVGSPWRAVAAGEPARTLRRLRLKPRYICPRRFRRRRGFRARCALCCRPHVVPHVPFLLEWHGAGLACRGARTRPHRPCARCAVPSHVRRSPRPPTTFLRVRRSRGRRRYPLRRRSSVDEVCAGQKKNDAPPPRTRPGH